MRFNEALFTSYLLDRDEPVLNTDADEPHMVWSSELFMDIRCRQVTDNDFVS